MSAIKLPEPTESQVVSACIKWLWANGCYVWRQNTGAYKPEGSLSFIRFGTKGCADIIGLTPAGRFLAVEAKRPSKRKNLSPDQNKFRQHVESCYGIYIVACGIDDLEAVKEKLT